MVLLINVFFFPTGEQASYKFEVEITTGEYKGQNVTGKGTVCMRLWNVNGNDNIVSNTFEIRGKYFFQGSKTVVNVKAPFQRIDQLELWIKRDTGDSNLNWFVETIKCTELGLDSKPVTLFPMQRWITMRHEVRTNGTCRACETSD